jgi:hypothetical protein
MRTICGYRGELTMGFACLLATATAVPTAQAGTTTTLTNYGSNPKNQCRGEAAHFAPSSRVSCLKWRSKHVQLGKFVRAAS